MKKTPRYIRHLNCKVCGTAMTSTAKIGQKRKAGHIKHMYCPMCRCVQPFIEEGSEAWR